MAKAWRQILEKQEATSKKRTEWEEEHPPITRISVENANGQRTLQTVGKIGITCNLFCYGDHIPKEYDHGRKWIDVSTIGINVNNQESASSYASSYYAVICGLTLKRICVARDETLRRAVEK